MKKFLWPASFVLLLIAAVGCAVMDDSVMNSSFNNRDIREVLKASALKNGTATATNTKLPEHYKRAKYLGLFINHSNRIVQLINPDFDVHHLSIWPGDYAFLPVKTIPDEIQIIFGSEKLPRRIKIYRNSKEYYSIMAEFGAIIDSPR